MEGTILTIKQADLDSLISTVQSMAQKMDHLQAAGERRFLSKKEVAEKLGNISPATFERLRRQDGLPVDKIMNKVGVWSDKLSAWIESKYYKS